MFTSRVLGVLVFDAAVFEEVEADPHATWQAAVVVVISSLATGFAVGGLYDSRLSTFAVTSGIALAMWVAWAMLTLQIGTRLLPERDTRASLGQLLRTIGFAAAPGWLQVLAVFPNMRAVIIGGTSAWMFALMVVAVQRALDYEHIGRAVAVCALGLALALGLAVILALLLTRVAG